MYFGARFLEQLKRDDYLNWANNYEESYCCQDTARRGHSTKVKYVDIRKPRIPASVTTQNDSNVKCHVKQSFGPTLHQIKIYRSKNQTLPSKNVNFQNIPKHTKTTNLHPFTSSFASLFAEDLFVGTIRGGRPAEEETAICQAEFKGLHLFPRSAFDEFHQS